MERLIDVLKICGRVWQDPRAVAQAEITRRRKLADWAIVAGLAALIGLVGVYLRHALGRDATEDTLLENSLILIAADIFVWGLILFGLRPMIGPVSRLFGGSDDSARIWHLTFLVSATMPLSAMMDILGQDRTLATVLTSIFTLFVTGRLGQILLGFQSIGRSIAVQMLSAIVVALPLIVIASLLWIWQGNALLSFFSGIGEE